MRFGIILAVCLLVVLGNSLAATQPNGDLASPTQQTMEAGTSQPVWFLYALNSDCTSAGSPIVQIVRAASHGSVDIKNVDHFTEYPSTNERYECNRIKSPSLAVIYSPEPSFVGIDGASGMTRPSGGGCVTQWSRAARCKGNLVHAALVLAFIDDHTINER